MRPEPNVTRLTPTQRGRQGAKPTSSPLNPRSHTPRLCARFLLVHRSSLTHRPVTRYTRAAHESYTALVAACGRRSASSPLVLPPSLPQRVHSVETHTCRARERPQMSDYIAGHASKAHDTVLGRPVGSTVRCTSRSIVALKRRRGAIEALGRERWHGREGERVAAQLALLGRERTEAAVRV